MPQKRPEETAYSRQRVAAQIASRACDDDYLSIMSEDVEQTSERVTDEKAPHAPRLALRTVVDRQPGGEDTLVDRLEVVHLYRNIRYRRARSTLRRDADLGRGKPF